MAATLIYRPHEQITEPEDRTIAVPPRPPATADPEAATSPSDVLDKAGLASRLKMCTRSVERGCQNGQLPKPALIGDRPYWIWGDVVDHLFKRRGKVRAKKTRNKPARSPDQDRNQLPLFPGKIV